MLRVGVRASLVGAVLASGAVQLASAQAPIEWKADWFGCAVFDEGRTSNVRTDVAGLTREETIRREGRLVLRADAPAASVPMALTAWYDSLVLSRRSLDGDLRPDLDVVLGGRFVGTLSPGGRYTASRRPFVPDAVRDVSDIAATLDDLLPPLPTFALREGGRLSDTTGARFERLADSTAGSARLLRLLVRTEWDRPLGLATGDAGPGAREMGRRESRLTIEPARGLLRLERSTFTEGALPRSPDVRGPIRASLDERLVLQRRFEVRVDDCP